MLNPQSPTPLYHQLAGKLTERIRSGEFPPGSRIPSEHQLCADFAIGRPTVRQAIDLLVRRGLLNKRRGSGTYVREPQQEVALFSLDGTGAAFRDKGLVLETRILEAVKLAKISGDPGNPFEGDSAYRLLRLVLVEGAPALLEDIFLHRLLFKGLDRIDLRGASLSRIAKEDFHLRPTGGKQFFKIECPNGEYMRLLEIQENTPVLRVDRFLNFQQIENGFFSRLYCRNDRFVFSQPIGGSEHE